MINHGFYAAMLKNYDSFNTELVTLDKRNHAYVHIKWFESEEEANKNWKQYAEFLMVNTPNWEEYYEAQIDNNNGKKYPLVFIR